MSIICDICLIWWISNSPHTRSFRGVNKDEVVPPIHPFFAGNRLRANSAPPTKASLLLILFLPNQKPLSLSFPFMIPFNYHECTKTVKFPTLHFVHTSDVNNHAHINTVGTEHQAGLKQTHDLGTVPRQDRRGSVSQLSRSTRQGHDGNSCCDGAGHRSSIIVRRGRVGSPNHTNVFHNQQTIKTGNATEFSSVFDSPSIRTTNVDTGGDNNDDGLSSSRSDNGTREGSG